MFTIYTGKTVGSWFGSGLASFIPESRLTFVQFDSLSVKRPRRPESDVKDSSEKKINLKKFRWEHSVRKNRTTFPDVPLLPEIPRRNDQKNSLTTGFSGNFL